MPTRAVCDDAVVAGLLLNALVVDGEQGGTSQIFQRNETEWDTGTVCCIRCWKVEHRCGKSRWRATDPKGGITLDVVTTQALRVDVANVAVAMSFALPC